MKEKGPYKSKRRDKFDSIKRDNIHVGPAYQKIKAELVESKRWTGSPTNLPELFLSEFCDETQIDKQALSYLIGLVAERLQVTQINETACFRVVDIYTIIQTQLQRLSRVDFLPTQVSGAIEHVFKYRTLQDVLPISVKLDQSKTRGERYLAVHHLPTLIRHLLQIVETGE